jgi:hypothetical protein
MDSKEQSAEVPTESGLTDVQHSIELLISPNELEINRLAFERGLAALQSQSALLDNLRQRSGVVATLSSLAATFLGREALSDTTPDRGWSIGALGILEILALLSITASAVCLIQVLRPRKGWVFDFSPTLILDQFARGPKATTLCNTYHHLSRFSQEAYDSNEQRLASLHHWLWASIFALLLQIYFWTMDFI